MKKICVAACMLCFLCLHIPRGAVSLPFEGRYSFYVTEAVFPDGCDVIDAGIFYIITCDFSDAPSVRERLDGVVGESVTFAGGEKDFAAAVETMGRVLFRGEAGGDGPLREPRRASGATATGGLRFPSEAAGDGMVAGTLFRPVDRQWSTNARLMTRWSTTPHSVGAIFATYSRTI